MKKFFYFFALSAIVLGMASCGDGNDPFAGKAFRIFANDITTKEATILINPSDLNAPYYWALQEADEVDAYGSLEDYMKMEFNYKISEVSWEKGNLECKVPSQESGYINDLHVNTEYMVIVFNVDEEGAPIFESAVALRFATLPPFGGLKGWFSVGQYKKVFFSKGNLYFKNTVGKYYFQDNQWDYIGNAADYSSTATTFDLFSWGTGSSPYTTSTDGSYFTNFTDWGDKRIDNGGNADKLWRTLTMEEWEYICHLRDNADKLVGLGKVHGVNGLILLPDKWQPTAGKSAFKSVSDAQMPWNSNGYKDEVATNNHFEDNDLSDKEWEALEESGAVFLPAAGQRVGVNVDKVGTYGSYWCKDKITTMPNLARDIVFEQNRLALKASAGVYMGLSVRLVWAGN